MDAGGNGGRSYNNTFGRLVDESNPGFNDVLGMVAYALYKREKREWATGIQSAKGRPPERGDLEWWESTLGDNRINGLKQQADEVLNRFALSIIENARPEIEEAAVEQARPGIEFGAITKKFWVEVGAGFLAALIYTLLLIGLAIILKFSGVDLLNFYEGLGAPG